ncbi:hypothetical protein FACS18949_18060 [Clostridia bacterium]|nr:hypothetical protein FACS18949_18060 [Clostridia bacterium]
MVHCNECTVRIDPWVKLFGEAFELFGFSAESGELYRKLYEIALDGGSKLSEFMRTQLENALCDLADGMRILTQKENVKIDYLTGHGGYFKSGTAGQTVMSEMLGIPVKLVEQSAEGGAYGCALLAARMGGSL